TLLCAALADKDVAGIVDVLIPAFPRVVVTQTDSDRALPAEELAALVDSDKLAGVYPSVSEALAAFEAAGEPFVAAGTITLAGEVAGLLR
ncbi:MAG: bifunctional folylpolyglutamate synthase/dihydrofolate synthase, partial [Collinsella sp.]|nr:bifunctional folylpolyglutamate synthase/dihydrofolate synthase [Collinsella sp.]